MIDKRDEITLKVAAVQLVKTVDELKEKIDNVISAQEKVEASIQEFTEEKRSNEVLSVMKTDDVKQAISDKLNTQLVNSTVKVDVKEPVVSIDKQSKQTINNLISSVDNLIESNKSIKPHKPLLNITINGGKKLVKFGLGIISICLIVTVGAIIWANVKVNSIEEQAFYWGNRAYLAYLRSDEDDPGKAYHIAVSHFEEQPEKVKRFVDVLEKNAADYQEIKSYILSVIGEKDSRDVRVLAWELDGDEYWILYRFFDEETKRSIHKWPNGKVEETTDKIVKNIATAQKYSKRKIWTTIRNTPEANTKKE